MIYEHATITVNQGQGEAFAAAVAEAEKTVFPRCEGWRSVQLLKCIETPDTFVVQIGWDTLEAHTVTFREGPLFAEWRALVGPHFAAPPAVLHYEIV